MDNKTLEYMGERVDKARKLGKKIDGVNKQIESLNTGEPIGICFVNPYNSTQLGKYYNTTPSLAILSQIQNTAINTLTAYRDSLQHELDEL